MMEKLSDMIYRNKLNVLLVNDSHVQTALATVLKCSVNDVPTLVDGELEFQTIDGPVTLVYFTETVGPNAMIRYLANSKHAIDLHRRAAQENKTILVVSGWSGAFRRPRACRHPVFLSARAAIVANDGSGALVLRDRSGESERLIPV